MKVIDKHAVEAALDWDALVEALQLGFRAGCALPVRHQHPLNLHDDPAMGGGNTLLLMPAWTKDYIGMKQVAVFPDNGAAGLPAVSAAYLLTSGKTGQPLALIDGEALTARRTAAGSALAARYLVGPQARRLLMVGTGSLAPNLIAAHLSQNPSLRHVLIWGRDQDKAQALAHRLSEQIRPLDAGLQCEVVADLEPAARSADLISCATLATEPLIAGAWLKPGAHLDLVGAFKPSMHEADTQALLQSQLFVDTRAGAIPESGEIQTAMREANMPESHVLADLYDLCRDQHPGRQGAAATTVFKNVGNGLVDLYAAILAYQRCS